MAPLLSIENIIKDAKKRGFDFGSGDPYNRLRYYTKMGWLPHMQRLRENKNTTEGHYPAWTVSRLLLIQQLKSQGRTNEEITKRLETKTHFQNVVSFIKTPEVRFKGAVYACLILLILILLNELDVLHLGKSKNTLIKDTIQGIQNSAGFTPCIPTSRDGK